MDNEKINGAKRNVLTVKANPQLREDFNCFCAERGISVSMAVVMFIRALCKTDDSSFNDVIPDKKYLPASGVSIGIYLTNDIRHVFSKYCTDRGYKMSTAVRMFMMKSIQTGEMWMPVNKTADHTGEK